MNALVTALLGLAIVGTGASAAHAQRTTLDHCISVVAGDVARFLSQTMECSVECEERIGKGELAPDTECTFPSDDAKTQICLLRANEAMTGSRSRARQACTDREIELFFGGTFTCPGANTTVEQLTGCLRAQAEFFANDLVRQALRPKFTVQ